MGIPILTMVFLDSALIAATALVAGVAWRHRRAASHLGIAAGVAWILAGMVATALFYGLDLLEVLGLPVLPSPSRSVAVETNLILHWGWLNSLVADGAILAGLWYLVRILLPRASADRAALAEEVAACQRAEDHLRELQGKVLLAERLSTTEEFAGSVAHSINNPLTALIGALSMAHETGATPELIEASLRTAGRIKDFVRNLTQLFRTGALDLSACDLRVLLEQVRRELEEGARAVGVEIVLEIEADVRSPWIDRSLLSAALQCIGENGLAAMRENGGTLVLSARSLPRVEGVIIGIADSGPGVPRDDRTRIFEPFFTTKAHGGGLGLAIAYGVVKGHGGTIRVTDAPGGGALFGVLLPLRPNGISLRVADADGDEGSDDDSAGERRTRSGKA